MNTEQNRETVKKILEIVNYKFKTQKAVILTESDLKCQIYSELIKINSFGEPKETFDDGITGIAVHTETKFFDTNGLLKKAPDIVITDTKYLSIKSMISGEPLPTKQFNFTGDTILIELKLNRENKAYYANELKTVENDILKGYELNQRADALKFHLIVAVYDRYGKAKNQIEELFSKYELQPNTTLLYFDVT